MIWKTILVTFLTAGVWAQYDNIQGKKCAESKTQNEFEVVGDTFKNFAACVQKLYNRNILYAQIEAAKPVGALSAVFQKYCENSTPLKACILERSVAAISNPYEKLRGEINSVDNVLGQVIDFLCYNHGERISEFNENSGPSCFIEQSSQMFSCFDQIKQDVPNFNEALRLSQKEKCAKYGEVTSCIITTLQGCSNPTAGRMAETLFSSIYSESQCKDYQI